MKLSDLFKQENVVTGLRSTTKEDVLREIIGDLNERGLVTDFDHVLSDVVEREKVMSTGIGNGVAIPHAYTDGVGRLVAGFYRTDEGVDFDALDNGKVDLFFIILGPKASRRDHIKVLAKISRLLNHDDFREDLRNADGPEGVMSVFKRFGDK